MYVRVVLTTVKMASVLVVQQVLSNHLAPLVWSIINGGEIVKGILVYSCLYVDGLHDILLRHVFTLKCMKN